MTVEEKLALFSEQSINNTKAQIDSELEQYKAELDKKLASFKHDIDSHVREELAVGREQVERESNRDIATEARKQKLRVAKRRGELTNELFKHLILRFEELKQEDEATYLAILNNCLSQVKEKIGSNDTIECYIDKSDAKLQQLLIQDNVKVFISDAELIGGLRVVVPSSSIMIDLSLQALVNEARQTFNAI